MLVLKPRRLEAHLAYTTHTGGTAPMGGYTRLYAVGIFRYDVRPLVESNLAKKPHRTVAAAVSSL